VNEFNLPAWLEVQDYHEFPVLQDHLRQIFPGIKVKEIATGPTRYSNPGCFAYHGVAYVGRKNASEVQSLILDISKHCRDEE